MSPKTLVTHLFPDLDAISSLWLFNRYDLDFSQAEIKFVPAGLTLKGQTVDSDPSVVHVDTGLGRFDHHHTSKRTCAARLVFEHLKKENKIRKKDLSALERLTELVIQVDHFEDFNWSDPASDRYDFSLHHLLDHLKLSGKLNDKELSFQGFSLLDAVLYGLRFKIQAEEELKKGTQFQSYLGRSIGVETKISRVSKLGQKMGYALVVRKEPETHFVSIKSQPLPELDLTKAFEALKKGDPNADWYFHPSKHIILNGSRHNAKVKPSHLSISELISIIKNC